MYFDALNPPFLDPHRLTVLVFEWALLVLFVIGIVRLIRAETWGLWRRRRPYGSGGGEETDEVVRRQQYPRRWVSSRRRRAGKR